MGKILCATRGGEASFRTQDKAIALAKDQGDELIFLFVADVSFLDNTAAPVVVDIEQEMVQMGEFLLAMAQERAAAQGVRAQQVVRRGKLRIELPAAAKELGATLIVIGRPADRHGVFDAETLHTFADYLRDVTGIKVWAPEIEERE